MRQERGGSKIEEEMHSEILESPSYITLTNLCHQKRILKMFLKNLKIAS